MLTASPDWQESHCISFFPIFLLTYPSLLHLTGVCNFCRWKKGNVPFVLLHLVSLDFSWGEPGDCESACLGLWLNNLYTVHRQKHMLFSHWVKWVRAPQWTVSTPCWKVPKARVKQLSWRRPRCLGPCLQPAREKYYNEPSCKYYCCSSPRIWEAMEVNRQVPLLPLGNSQLLFSLAIAPLVLQWPQCLDYRLSLGVVKKYDSPLLGGKMSETSIWEKRERVVFTLLIIIL